MAKFDLEKFEGDEITVAKGVVVNMAGVVTGFVKKESTFDGVTRLYLVAVLVDEDNGPVELRCDEPFCEKMTGVRIKVDATSSPSPRATGPILRYVSHEVAGPVSSDQARLAAAGVSVSARGNGSGPSVPAPAAAGAAA